MSGETFATRLRAARRRAGLSKYRLAALVGCTEAAVRSWECGRTAGPSLFVGLRIARELHVDPLDLAFGEQPVVNG